MSQTDSIQNEPEECAEKVPLLGKQSKWVAKKTNRFDLVIWYSRSGNTTIYRVVVHSATLGYVENASRNVKNVRMLLFKHKFRTWT